MSYAEKIAMLEVNLNSTKTMIDKIYVGPYARDYDTFTDLINTTDIHRNVKKSLGLRFATNAFVKMWELILYLTRGRTKPKKIRHFGNTELPGGFIYAMMTFCQSRSIQYEWIASSYLDKEGNASNAFFKDQYGMVSNYSNNWVPNIADTNGDMLIEHEIDTVIKATKSRFSFGVDLYTADGGIPIDKVEDFNRQEELNIDLKFGEALTGLETLIDGGDFVLKVYTLFTDQMICLISLLRKCFDEVDIVKPVSSRPGNSELYVVGKGFEHNEEVTSILRSYMFAAGGLPPLTDSDYEFVYEKSKEYVMYQIDTIMLNLNSFDKRINISKEDIAKHVTRRNRQYISQFIDTFNDPKKNTPFEKFGLPLELIE